MARDLLYEKFLRPFFFGMDPESVHELAHHALKMSSPLLPALGLRYKKDDLQTELFSTSLQNPIGIAAGFDKNGNLIEALSSLGFGFAEIGSVCARPHGGNPKPRLFRLEEDAALINRLGLNGLGADVVSRFLKSKRFELPVGINIAKTNDPSISASDAVKDIVYTFECVKSLPIKYVTLNTSCPNTAEGALKESEHLDRVLDALAQSNTAALPLLLKLSPDSGDSFLQEVLKQSERYKISGFVCGNTTISRAELNTPAERLKEIGNGGLSGRPLKKLNLELTRKIAAEKKSEQIIIGVGGIITGADAFEYLDAGAGYLQIYTGFVYRGPSAVRQICEELSQILKEKGLKLSSFADRSKTLAS
ncbi:MAG: quinone-dependent dihydroorotate dehydrogenase [Candidatus Obscuribacterales bacterium]|nr:quinone-dependent dihydroorotate dehydrogenase [Candidatus Obscuribacterales bacterium]